MNLLITGAMGFMGQHLLKRYPDAITMDKKRGSSTEWIGLLERIVESKDIDIIVHLGANCSSQISLREPLTDFRDNALGTFNVVEVARKNNIPVIFNSTMKVYPGEDGIIPPYGISKLVGEMYLDMYHKVYGLDYIINRPSSVYGPLQDGSEDGGWFTWFIKAKMQDKTITVFGDGNQSRDVLYIDDMIDLLQDQIENFKLYKNQDFIMGGGLENEVSLNELIKELDHKKVFYTNPLQGDVKRFVCDNTKTTNINGWVPKVGWRDGLERTLEYERSSNT